MKNLLKKYNSAETLIVITSFPNPVSGKYGKRDFNAIGEHSERRLPYIAKKRPVLVLAEEQDGRKYFEIGENIAVARLWKKGNIFSILKLISFIREFDKARSVLVQFEFNVMGGILPNLALLLLLLRLKLSGKFVVFEMHQVPQSIGSVKKHVNIQNPLLQFIYNTGLKIFYVASGIATHKILVFEEEMKERLRKFVHESKIEVLCLSVDLQKTIHKKLAREKLGLPQRQFTILVFGFINGYKGIDWILDALKDEEKSNINLIIAGGKNPYLMHKPYYQKFYKSIVMQAKKQKHVIYTDFVPDDKVYLYYSAADLAVLPYTAFISASGPFSRALAHNKAILISKKLANYAKSRDFKRSLNQTGLKKEDVIFPLEKKSFLKLVNRARSNNSYLSSLNNFSESLAQSRNIEKISLKLDGILFAKSTPAEVSIKKLYLDFSSLNSRFQSLRLIISYALASLLLSRRLSEKSLKERGK
jgi:glycosyltransferase involved in cell wall biosynthesis